MIYTLIIKNELNQPERVISFECVKSMKESYSTTVTSTTVEYGFRYSDNMNIENPTYQLNTAVSAYSMFSDNAEITWSDGDFKTSGDRSGLDHLIVRDALLEEFYKKKTMTILESRSNSFQTTTPESRYEDLRKTVTREIENCVITSLDIDVPEKSGGVLNISMTLEKLSFAKVITVALTPEQMIPSVVPIVAESTTKPANTSPSSESATPNGAQKTSDKDVDVKEDSGINKGSVKYAQEQAKQHEFNQADGKAHAVALEKAINRASTTGRMQKVVKEGGNWTLAPLHD